MVRELESDGGFELLELAGANLDVKVVPFVGNLEDFGPSESVDPQSIAEDQNAGGANPDQDVHTVRVLEGGRCVRIGKVEGMPSGQWESMEDET